MSVLLEFGQEETLDEVGRWSKEKAELVGQTVIAIARIHDESNRNSTHRELVGHGPSLDLINSATKSIEDLYDSNPEKALSVEFRQFAKRAGYLIDIDEDIDRLDYPLSRCRQVERSFEKLAQGLELEDSDPVIDTQAIIDNIQRLDINDIKASKAQASAFMAQFFDENSVAYDNKLQHELIELWDDIGDRLDRMPESRIMELHGEYFNHMGNIISKAIAGLQAEKQKLIDDL